MKNFRQRLMGFFVGFFTVVIVNLVDFGLHLELAKNTKIIIYIVLILSIYLVTGKLKK